MISDRNLQWNKERSRDTFRKQQEKQTMKVLKIATAGSVDDGKSTLIGRLLYDTDSLTADKVEAISNSSKKKGYDYLDFSLATDGLVAEREQGITIDVAHIYFSTANRSYIIADTPGHVEYTRNMVTGASTSQVAIILIDARNGVSEQTVRHFYINNLLRIKKVIVAVNKMDLVGYDRAIFETIRKEVTELAEQGDYLEQEITFVPISALVGDNVVEPSTHMDWFEGTTILAQLEQMEWEDIVEPASTRFPIQTVIRPKSDLFHDFRGYTGKLLGGDLNVGDAVTILPSHTTSTIASIELFGTTYQTASKGTSITVTLADDVDVSRGDMVVKTSELPRVSKSIDATICWMDKKSLNSNTRYIIQHGTHSVLGKVALVTNDMQQLEMNQMGKAQIQLSKALYYDTYQENKQNGAFILVDPQTNTTAGVGFINA